MDNLVTVDNIDNQVEGQVEVEVEVTNSPAVPAVPISHTFLDQLPTVVTFGNDVSNRTLLTPPPTPPRNYGKPFANHSQCRPQHKTPTRSYSYVPNRAFKDVRKINCAEIAKNSSRFLNSNELRYLNTTSDNALATAIGNNRFNHKSMKKPAQRLLYAEPRKIAVHPSSPMEIVKCKSMLKGTQRSKSVVKGTQRSKSVVKGTQRNKSVVKSTQRNKSCGGQAKGIPTTRTKSNNNLKS